MAQNGEPALISLEEIRRGLDPAYSYMFFERTAGLEMSEEADFSEIFEVLLRLGLEVRESRVVKDGVRKRAVLVVKFDPGRTDSVMEALMNIGLPEDITFWAYGSQVMGG